MKKIRTVKNLSFYQWDENIFYAEFNRTTTVCLEDAKLYLEAYILLKEQQERPGKLLILTNISKVKGIDRASRKYLEHENGILSIIEASALIVENNLARLLGNFLLKFLKGKIPVKIFTNQDVAGSWLKSFSATATA